MAKQLESHQNNTIDIICVNVCVVIILSLIQNNGLLSIEAQKIKTENNNISTYLTRTNAANVGSQQISSVLTDLFNKTENSVVQITSQSNATNLRDNALVGRTTASGSGFVYDNQGHIITNDHVIEGHKIVDVEFADGNTYKAKVIGIDSYTDLAVLQIADNFSNERLIPIKFGNSSLLQVGEMVAAIGNPLGLQNLMTEGIISGLHVLLPSNQASFSIPDIIVTDVPLNPGNSGGPLLNMQGEIIGMNTAIASVNQFPDLSYSISSNIIKKIVPQLIAHGSYIHPWLGVTGTSLTPELERGTGLPINYRGVMVSSVQSGSPAASVNLQPITVKHMGDIIIAIDGHFVKRFEDIINYIESSKSVGNTIIVKLLRNGIARNVDIKLTPNPIPINVNENTKTTTPTLSKLAIKNWTKIIGLSNSNISSQGPRLAASGNNVYAVWEESHDGINRIIFAKSTDRGNTFSKPANLTSGIRVDSETPSIGAIGNNVYIVWTDNSLGNFDIFFIKSTDGGNTFSKPLNLSNDPGLSYLPRIATAGKNSVYVVWTDNSLGNYNILFSRSSNAGASFDKPIILSNLKGVSNFPSITTYDNNSVYVVWSHKNNTDFDPSNTENQTQTYDIFFTKSLDRGTTFSKPVNLSDDPGNSQGPAVAVSEKGIVYVVWTDNSVGTYETFFTKSLDRGNTFSKVSVISSNVARSISPSISAYGNNTYVVWSDNTFGNDEIFFMNSMDNGSTFNMPININEDAGISGVAQITIAPEAGNLYLIWQDNAIGNPVIYFTKTHLTSHLNISEES